MRARVSVIVEMVEFACGKPMFHLSLNASYLPVKAF